MKKILSFKTATVILLIITVVLSSVCLIMNSRYRNSQSLLAEQNLRHWSNLHLATIRTDLFSSDTYINSFALTYNVTAYVVHGSLYPKDYLGKPGFDNFLTLDLVPLIQDIASKSIPDMYSQEAKDLILEVNRELGELSNDVLVCCEENTKAKTEFLNSNSALSKEYTKKIRKFTDKNHEKIEKFRNKIR